MSEKPVKKRRKPRAVGPLSRKSSLAAVDGRTLVGRILKQVRSELVAHLGGDPSVAELLLIENAAMKSARVALLSQKLAEGGEIAPGADHHVLAWSNSLRLDLMALGLQRRVRDVTPRLSDIIKAHADKPAQRPETLQATPVSPEPVSPTDGPPSLDLEVAE
jgi:hypothetical protein